jgi:hypothetical protein
MSALRTASAEEVLRLLRHGEEVRSLQISEELTLRAVADGDDVRAPIRFVDCSFGKVDISFLQFQRLVSFESCSIESLFGMSSYFFAGLAIERCVLISPTDLSCGGHNRGGHSIVLADTTFAAFVNFADCWFEGPFVVQRCTFEGGTNLLGNREQLYGVTFDVPPVLEENRGQLGLET